MKRIERLMHDRHRPLVQHDPAAHDTGRPSAPAERAGLDLDVNRALAVAPRHSGRTLTVGIAIVTLLLAGCGGGGVSSASDAEGWVHDRFTSDVMEVNEVECENAPGDRYRCVARVVTVLGVDFTTGWVDCEAKCVWRPVKD